MPVRNNEDRLGNRDLGDTSPIPQAQQSTSPTPFSFVVPTEFIELPSKGRYYPEGHPLHKAEVVEIKHMTAKEEDLLTSKSLLKKGLAVDRVLQNVIVNKGINPDSLLIGDKNAIIIATRVFAYGADYQTRVTCPACTETIEYDFDLNEVGFNHEGDHGEYSESISRKGNNFVVSLPKTNVRVEIRLLTGQDEKFLARAMEMKRKQRMPETTLTDQFRLFIVSVNDRTDKESITKFVEIMPASDSRFLRSAYEKIVPNVDMTQEFVCNNCGYEAAMEVPLSADFFWPRG